MSGGTKTSILGSEIPTRCTSHMMGVSCRISSSSAYSSDILSTIWLHCQMTETAGLRAALGANLMFAFSTQKKQRGASGEGAMGTKEIATSILNQQKWSQDMKYVCKKEDGISDGHISPRGPNPGRCCCISAVCGSATPSSCILSTESPR